MKKSHLKEVHLQLSDIINEQSTDYLFGHYFHQALDTIESKLYKPKPPKPKREKPENVCNIFFENKGVEFINIARIMRNKDVASVLPNTSTKFSVPMVTYSLSPPLAGKLFNFNQFVNSLDMDEFLSNPNILPCNCKNSPFIDKYHKHIITGDLRIISNSNLRKLFS